MVLHVLKIKICTISVNTTNKNLSRKKNSLEELEFKFIHGFAIYVITVRETPKKSN